jgi:y4mF family transcriptional regulator
MYFLANNAIIIPKGFISMKKIYSITSGHIKQIDNMKNLGALVRAIRKEQGLTQEQLCAVCGVGLRFLRELEQGKETCQIGKVIKTVQILGIDIYVLRRGEPLS